MSQFDNEHRARLSPLRRRVHKTLGVRLFSPAPDDFNPIEATDRELQVHGYPARPDPNLWPELHQRWQRVFSLPLSMIEPQFAVMPPMSRPPIRPEMPQAGVSGSANWSGSIAKLKEGSKAAFVTGEWTVPDIATPGSLAYSSAIWVGIDGSDDQQPGPVQAGTTIGRLTGSRDTFAWYEWVPEGPVCISNFPVSSGDVVICTLCANSPTEAAFYLLNETRRIGTSLIKTVPDGAKEMDFSTAEWILEHPMNTTPPLNSLRTGRSTSQATRAHRTAKRSFPD